MHDNKPLHLLLEQRGSDPFTINGEAFGEVRRRLPGVLTHISQCFTIIEVVDLMRSLGPTFQYRLTKPLGRA